jgi:DNA-binding CsgD family transcriptional regulator
VLLNSKLLTEPAWQAVARSFDLTHRELQILRAVFDDGTEFATGVDLGISAHTVHAHSRQLFHKLGVSTRVGAVLRVWNELVLLILLADEGLPPLCPHWAAGRCARRRRPEVPPEPAEDAADARAGSRACPDGDNSPVAGWPEME